MKNTFKICVCAAALFSLAACKKSETRLLGIADNIAGSWKLQLQGVDANSNAKFDVEEKNTLADSAKFYYLIQKGGSGYKTGANNTYVDTMEWRLYNYDANLHFKIYDKGFTNNLYYKFEFTSKSLLLIDTTVSPTYFRLFERQN